MTILLNPQLLKLSQAYVERLVAEYRASMENMPQKSSRKSLLIEAHLGVCRGLSEYTALKM